MTIGLLTPGDPNGRTPALWNGVREIAHERGANLIRFDSTANDSPDNDATSIDLIQRLASPSTVDGVILCPGTAQSYVDQYRSLPMVSIGGGVRGVPQVLIEHPTSLEHASPLLYAQGRRAAEMLFVMIKNRPVPDRVRVSASSAIDDPSHCTASQTCMRERDLLLHHTGLKIHNALALDELGQTVSQHFPQLDIPACSVVLYGRHPVPMLPLTSKLMFGFDERGSIVLPSGGQRFPTRKLLPGDILEHAQPHTLVVEALSFRGQALGYVIFEAGTQKADTYRILAGQLGGALGRIVAFANADSMSVDQAA